MSAIEVGMKVMVELPGMKDKLHTRFVGYINKRCVITTIPLVPEVNRSMLYEHLYKGNAMTVRFIKSGSVLGFATLIQHVSFSPFPLLFLEFPDKIESFNLRKDSRVNCLFPVAMALNGTTIQGALLDISKSGCGIGIQGEESQKITFEIDDVVRVQCPFLFKSEDERVDCVIKRINKSGSKVDLGLKFNQIPESLLSVIHDYVQQMTMYLDD
ncbi:flagellar brake protein [Desulfonatronum thiosulfatophilum]|uniref:flagellar brake protein n=1 Tax=Desulfonatronum thiosulfatophilum TaxID=617002 RepID=UPI00137B61B4|nr:flagellar brake protein [Desulfonatronum thiosulfatophilum]